MEITKLLEHAKLKCQQGGAKLTFKRSEVLKTLLQAKRPLSAYELVERLKEESGHSMQPMSAYRMLDLFVELDLVHKLNSSNKYIACAHLGCEHRHQDQYFVVCQSCGKAQEVSIGAALLEQIESSVVAAGFQLRNKQFELDCLCNDCAAQQA